MREAFENKDLLQTKAKRALEDSKAYTWDNSAQKAYECTKETFK